MPFAFAFDQPLFSCFPYNEIPIKKQGEFQKDRTCFYLRMQWLHFGAGKGHHWRLFMIVLPLQMYRILLTRNTLSGLF